MLRGLKISKANAFVRAVDPNLSGLEDIREARLDPAGVWFVLKGEDEPYLALERNEDFPDLIRMIWGGPLEEVKVIEIFHKGYSVLTWSTVMSQCFEGEWTRSVEIRVGHLVDG